MIESYRKAGGFNVRHIYEAHLVADMRRMQGRDDDEIAVAVERTYVGAQLFVRLFDCVRVAITR
jgi:hypothetical protein